MKNVLIVGGGAGGLILANSLDTDKYNITILDKSIYHFYQPWYLYVAFRGSRRKIWKRIDELIKPGVNFRNEAVTNIDLNERKVVTNAGNTYTYDYLAIGTGTSPDPSVVPGLDEITRIYGNYHSTYDNALKLYSNFEKFSGGTFVLGQASPVCKCPPSMLEGIFLAEEYINKKGLKDKTKFIFFTPFTRAYSAEPMNKVVMPLIEKRNIEVIPFFNIDHVDTEKKEIVSMEGETIKYDFPVIVPPCRGIKDIKYNPENILDDDLFIKADKYTMKVQGYDDVFAIGDANTLPVSKTGVTAHLEAKVVADIIEGFDSKFNGRINCPFDVGYGEATFVIADYNNPVAPFPPSKFKHLLKMTMADIYWLTLKGTVDFVFDIYFNYYSPESLLKKYPIEAE